MFDFLAKPFADAPPSNLVDVLARLLVAGILGVGIAWVYRATRTRNDTPPTFPGTLVLLAVLIAMVTQVIGDNVARAFSLVGALSIVRFRTVVRDTQDTAFVIFAVVIGMAVGARDVVVAGIGIVVVSGAAFLMKPRARQTVPGAATYLLNLRLGLGYDIEALVGNTLDASLSERFLVSMNTARQGLAVEVTYRGRLRDGANAEELVKALNRIEGVQRVELGSQSLSEVRD